METIRCANCGQPVVLRGGGWECQWCGNCGQINSLSLRNQKKVPAVWAEQNLPGLVRDFVSILKGMDLFFGEEEGDLWGCKLTLYGITRTLALPQLQTERNLMLLQLFLQDRPFCDGDDVLALVEKEKTVFVGEFLLTSQKAGSFWQEVISRLPQYGGKKSCPVWLDQVLKGWARVESCFSRENSTKLAQNFWELFAVHWEAAGKNR